MIARRPSRLRSLIIVALVLIGALGLVGWRGLDRASALATSYSAAVSPSRSLVIDAHDIVYGVGFFRNTAERLVAGASSDRDRLEALMRWANENVRPQYAAPERVVSDNFVQVVLRGFGYCDQTAHVFATLAHYAGYDVRMLFLRDANGISPHSVAEVRVGDRWVLVDPWLGTLFTSPSGELIGTSDLRDQRSLPGGYQVMLPSIEVAHFERGGEFRTFPYVEVQALARRVWERIGGASKDAPRTPGPRTGGAAPADAATGSGRDQTVSTARDLEDQLLRMNAARRAHLEGRYVEAIEGYRGLLDQRPPTDMRDAIRFFLGLALLRADQFGASAKAFSEALDEHIETDWQPSILFYRAEAYERLGRIAEAVQDRRSASSAVLRRLVAR